MSQMDVDQLKANFEAWKLERGEGLSDGRAFERYTFEQVLKDFDLADEDLDVGDFGLDKKGAELKGNDGGVDGMYLVMGGILVGEETEVPKATTEIELHLIQAKNEHSFKETTIEKMESFARDLFDYNRAPHSTGYLNSKVKDSIANYRAKYGKVFGKPHKLRVLLHYVCVAQDLPTSKDKVTERANNLVAYIQGINTAAEVRFVPWAAPQLWRSVLELPESTVALPCGPHFSTKGQSSACLVRLKDFATNVLMGKDGQLKTRILEPNVRDYQGKSNTVNEGIRNTLADKSSPEDFWWLNNGITILASGCSFGGDQVSISDPEIVNGLQTSYEVFDWYKSNLGTNDDRHIMLRIIVPPNDAAESSGKIIKATNSQTKVPEILLLSTDPIQQFIEDKLRYYGVFYDRKKGRCKREKRPITQVVGIKELAAAVLAVYVRKPDQARGRPETYVKDHKEEVFDTKVSGDVFVACVLVDRRIKAVLLAQPDLTIDQRRNIRYYADMYAISDIVKKRVPSADDLAASIDAIQSFDESVLSAIVDQVRDHIAKKTIEGVLADSYAKSSDLTKAIQQLVDDKYPTDPAPVMNSGI